MDGLDLQVQHKEAGKLKLEKNMKDVSLFLRKGLKGCLHYSFVSCLLFSITLSLLTMYACFVVSITKWLMDLAFLGLLLELF